MMIIEQKVGISLCTGGSATHIAGSHLCKLEKGVAIIVSPALPTVEVESSPDFRECVIAVDMSTISGETTPFFPRMMPVLSASAPILHLSPEMERRVYETARHIDELRSVHHEDELFQSMNERLMDLLRLQIILEIMYEMAANNRPSIEKPSRGEQVFIRFMQSLGLHFAERYPVSRYAEESHLTTRHFSTLIHQYSGQTPMQWITSYTISQAKHLLAQTDLSVKEIAEKLGFPEQFTFRKYFKTHAGESPTAFRRKE
jgi:AraC-like DNA-binding protein